MDMVKYFKRRKIDQENVFSVDNENVLTNVLTNDDFSTNNLLNNFNNYFQD
jgi:hypothetical protein